MFGSYFVAPLLFQLAIFLQNLVWFFCIIFLFIITDILLFKYLHVVIFSVGPFVSSMFSWLISASGVFYLYNAGSGVGI